MTFVTPLLLGGAALIAVPIALHLIMRQKPRLVEFPALRFIKQREETNRRQLRLRHLILLLLRCAAVALLALALARPSIQSSPLLADQEAPVAAAMIFDTSPRMEYRHENKTRLEASKDIGSWLLSQLPDESQVSVIDARATSVEFSVDLGAAKQRIERLSSTPAARPLPQIVGDALELLRQSELVRKEAYIFTDLALSAWPKESAAELQRRLSELAEIGVYVIDVGVLEPRNLTLDDLRLSAEAVAPGGTVNLQTQLISEGVDDERTVALYMVEGGEARKRGQQIVTPVSNGLVPLDFEVAGLQPGANHGYLQIVGGDSLMGDDLRHFTVEVRPSARLLIAAADPAERNARFLAEALAPTTYNRARFQCTVVSIGELSRIELEDYAAVCIVDPAPLRPAVWEQLNAYVKAGGGVAIWLGRNAQPIEEFNSPAAIELLPAALKRKWGNQEERLQPVYLDHPILAKFRTLESAPWMAPVYSFWQLDELSEGASVLLSYTGGQPALVEKIVGKGRVLTTTTTVTDEASAEDAWNVLLLHPDPSYFVVVNEMMAYLAGGDRLNYFVGDTAVLHIDKESGQSVFTLTTPRGDQIQQSVDPRTGNLTFTATDVTGSYTALAGGEQGVRKGFSVNTTAESTNLARLSAEELDGLLGEGRYRLARGQENLVREIGEARVGQELYPYLILLVAIVLAVEHVLANRFYRGERAKLPVRLQSAIPTGAAG